MRGRLAGIKKQKEISMQIAKYRSLRIALKAFCAMQILDFDEVAATEFQRLRKQYPRLAALDLKIAAIVLARRATLWTRNMKDFGQIAGLDAVDITKEGPSA
jgi:tRNA(fMet)-specific endonuclease VapC